MSNNAKVSFNHDEIKAWAEKHNGKPQIIDDPEAMADKKGIRIDFPGADDEKLLVKRRLHVASWEDFFKEFENQELALIYIDSFDSNNGEAASNSYRLIKREVLKEQSEEENQALVEEIADELITESQDVID